MFAKQQWYRWRRGTIHEPAIEKLQGNLASLKSEYGHLAEVERVCDEAKELLEPHLAAAQERLKLLEARARSVDTDQSHCRLAKIEEEQ